MGWVYLPGRRGVLNTDFLYPSISPQRTSNHQEWGWKTSMFLTFRHVSTGKNFCCRENSSCNPLGKIPASSMGPLSPSDCQMLWDIQISSSFCRRKIPGRSRCLLGNLIAISDQHRNCASLSALQDLWPLLGTAEPISLLWLILFCSL